LAILAGLLACLGNAQAQTWTPTSRTGTSFVGAGELSPNLHQITDNYSGLDETHDLIQVSVPATTTPSASASAQLDAVPSPTGMFLSIAGEALRGPIPCSDPACSGAVYSNTTQNDQWTFVLTQPVCYSLEASVTLFNDSGETAGQGFQFINYTNFTPTLLASGVLSATGSNQYSTSGTLTPGTYIVSVIGQADGNGAPRTASYSHWVSITLGPPLISTQPASVTACRDGSADFSVQAPGAACQWQFESSPNNWINAANGDLPYNGGTITASGVDTAHLHLALNTLPGAPSLRFRCVTSTECASVTSDPATLSIIACTCNPDFNGDGDIGTDSDIAAFFACLGGNCCPSCGSADFNGDGDIGTDADIESFFRVLGGGPC
jgi:hypothetical protein